MPVYHKLGLSSKDTRNLKTRRRFYYEQLLEQRGLVEIRRLYHVHRPTQVKEILKSHSVEPKIAIGKNIKSLLLKGFDLKAEDDFRQSKSFLSIKTVL
jgi:homogentisate 1,2-dioxygenase